MTMFTSEEVKVNTNITHGNATVVGTEKGWALPNRKHTNCPRYAKMMAIRMARLMTKLEVAQ